MSHRGVFAEQKELGAFVRSCDDSPGRLGPGALRALKRSEETKGSGPVFDPEAWHARELLDVIGHQPDPLAQRMGRDQ